MYEDKRSMVPDDISKVVYYNMCERDFRSIKKTMAAICDERYRLPVTRDNLLDVFVRSIRRRTVKRYACDIPSGFVVCSCDDEKEARILHSEPFNNIYSHTGAAADMSDIFDRNKSYIDVMICVGSTVNGDVMTIYIDKVLCRYVCNGRPKRNTLMPKFVSFDDKLSAWAGVHQKRNINEIIYSDDQLNEAINNYHYNGVEPTVYDGYVRTIYGYLIWRVNSIGYDGRIDISYYKEMRAHDGDII